MTVGRDTYKVSKYTWLWEGVLRRLEEVRVYMVAGRCKYKGLEEVYMVVGKYTYTYSVLRISFVCFGICITLTSVIVILC